MTNAQAHVDQSVSSSTLAGNQRICYPKEKKVLQNFPKKEFLYLQAEREKYIFL